MAVSDKSICTVIEEVRYSDYSQLMDESEYLRTERASSVRTCGDEELLCRAQRWAFIVCY